MNDLYSLFGGFAGSAGGSGGAQPDWNDLTNKPFGEETWETLFDGTVTTEQDGNYCWCEVGGPFIVGDTYIVTMNGVDYEVVAQFDEDGTPFIGNYSIWWSEHEDNGLPFAWGNGWFGTVTAGDYAVKIQRKTVSAMSGKYIEDGYYTEPDKIEIVYEGKGLAFAESTDWPFNTISGEYVYVDSAYSYSENTWTNTDNLGNTFLVMWDGVPYECTYQSNSSEMCCLGNFALLRSNYDDTGEPFCILTNAYYDSQGLYIGTLDGSASHSVSVELVKAGAVHQLPDKYLPMHSHDVSSDATGILSISNGGTGVNTRAKVLPSLGFGFGICSTAAGTATKSVSISNFVLVEGAVVGVAFVNASTSGSMRLNVSGTGAKEIVKFTATNTSENASAIGAGLHLFWYHNGYWVHMNPPT